jgi:anti-anti-sigma factor
MDLSNADLLTAVLDNQVGHGHRFMRLDVSRLSFLDCSGLGRIVHAHNLCLAARGTLVLTGVTPRIARLLAITHLDEALLIADGPLSPPPTRRSRHMDAVAAQ